jgi:4-(2-carboxyphenyl)-2-oxobut-3-enoate aldolase
MPSFSDLSGVMGMMPAFTTDDGASLDAIDTISIDRLTTGVNRIIEDGIGVISTCGSFGEFHTLLWEEWKTINRETVTVSAGRVPIFVGCTALNSREALKRIEYAAQIGAYGVLVGVPFYFPATIENTIEFYREVATRFPEIGIMVYHNPVLHNVKIPVTAFAELVEHQNIIGMKDSHRDTLEFIKLQEVVSGKIAVFCNQMQFHPYYSLGAQGFWSIDAWMGPQPMLSLYEAVVNNDTERAKEIYFELQPVLSDRKMDLSWRETAAKIAIRHAGYVDPGPLRPPFSIVPDGVLKAQSTRADKWRTLCEKYKTEKVATAAE